MCAWERFLSGNRFWEKTRFQWEVSPNWITALPSVVSGINIAIRAFSREGDGVIVQTPVYDPFLTIVKRTGRTLEVNQLKEENGRYEMDFEQLKRMAENPRNRMLILCSPHNPVGRVWTREELERLAEICIQNDVLIVTDEIHSDIVYGKRKHYPLLSLDRRYENGFIHLSAPGKTFNGAGTKDEFCGDSQQRAERTV